jgi:hypothetical protein
MARHSTPDPSPSEIEQRDAEIRATWSEAERIWRLRPDLRPQYRRCDGERETMTAVNYERHHSNERNTHED